MKWVIRALWIGALAIGSLSSAYSQTTLPPPGRNYDGVMSLIYDNSSGNVYVENAPLFSPAVQQLSIASAAGNLLYGNLSLPLLSPTVMVLSATPNLIQVTWSGGDFLGTGSSLGNILAPSLGEASLRADLTIDWAPASQALTPGDLIYGTFGTTEGNPVPPSSGGSGFWHFFNLATGQFTDPPLTNGYIYTIDAGMSPPGAFFTKVGFPLGLGNSFTVTSAEGAAGGIAEGGQHVFSGGVSTFLVTGISPAVDAGQSNAFPLYIEFSTLTASFSMQAISVPEPEAATLVAACAVAGVGAGRRRTKWK